MVTAGHLGSVQGLAAVGLRGALDGALAPLRNVHKFDPVLRLPLVLGLAFVVDAFAGRRPPTPATEDPGSATLTAGLLRGNQVAMVALSVLVVLGAALPALSGRLTPGGATLGVPDYWRATARWLGAHGEDGTALLAPGSAFGEYVWGAPHDEPLQSLATSRWAVRNAIPLAPPGDIRMLDAVETRFTQGRGSRGLAAYLHRAGVGYVVVRNDLSRGDDVPDPVVVHQALGASPGLTRVATFGPEVGGGAHLRRDGRRLVVNGGWQATYPAVEVFAVRPTAGRDRRPVTGAVARAPCRWSWAVPRTCST